LLQRDQFDPKYQVEWVAAYQPFFSQNYRVHGISCGIRMWAQLSFVLSHMTRLTDLQTENRRADRILIARPRLHSMQRGI